MKLKDISQYLSGEIVRDGEFENLGFISHDKPRMFVFLNDKVFISKLKKRQNVACVITSTELAGYVPEPLGLYLSSNPKKDFYLLHNHLAERTNFYWKDFPTAIAKDAIISPGVDIPDVNVRIGNRVLIEPGVIISPKSIIGNDVVIRAGSVVGTQGFEFKRINDVILSVAHAGGVFLHDRVEIQANCAISRAVFGGYTEIGEDTKLDNLVHIAHNVRIGKRCLLAACSMIAGSVVIGDDVWVGPGASISSEVQIGDKASITIGSVVASDVPEEARVTGNFAVEHNKFISFQKALHRMIRLRND